MRLPEINCLLKAGKQALAVPLIASLLLTTTFPLAGKCQSPSNYEPNALLAVVPISADMTAINAKLQALGASLTQNYNLGFIRLLKIKTASGQISQTRASLSSDKTFQGVQPNWRAAWAGTAATNDPLLPNQWNLFQMNLPKAWSTSKGTGSYIAFLDSGVALVRDLATKLTQGTSTLSGTSWSTDDASGGGHGTKLASLTCAFTNNNYEIAAVDPWAHAYPVKVGNASGADDEHIILGLSELIKSGVKVAVIGATPQDTGWTFLNDPIVYGMLGVYHDNGGLAFAPAGNNSAKLQAGSDPLLVLVSATDQNGQLASFSNYGNAVWFAAPGVNIYGIDNSGQAVLVSGTSASAAVAAGVTSLVWANNPHLSSADVLNILKRSASGQGQRNDQLGYGIIDAQAAVNAAVTGK